MKTREQVLYEKLYRRLRYEAQDTKMPVSEVIAAVDHLRTDLLFRLLEQNTPEGRQELLRYAKESGEALVKVVQQVIDENTEVKQDGPEPDSRPAER